MVDSLAAILPAADGTEKVDILNRLAQELAPRNNDSCLQFLESAYYLSEELEYSYGKGVATFNRGNYYYFKSDYKNALINYLAALRTLESFEPTRDIGNLYYQLASVNSYVRNTEKTREYYLHASSSFMASGDTLQSYVSLYMLGSSYFFKYQTLLRIDPLPKETVDMMMDSALKYNKFVLEWTSNRKVRLTGMVELLNSHGLYYSVKEIPGAEEYFNKALEYADKLTFNWKYTAKGFLYNNLGYYYFHFLKDNDQAYQYLDSAFDNLDRSDRSDLYSGALLVHGMIDLEEGRYASAEKCFLGGVAKADAFLAGINQLAVADPSFRVWGVTEARAFRIDCLKHLVMVYEATGNEKRALEYHKKFEEEKSFQILDGLNREMMGIQAQNDDEIKRQEIIMLARDNELHQMKLSQTRIVAASLGGFLLMIFIAIMLWIQRKRLRSEHKAMQLEQKLLRSRMNPHFLFNSLSSIQNFIVTEKPDKASIYLSKFSKLVRNILDNSSEEFVTLQKEISTIENYLELQKVRYSGKFDYQIEIDRDIDPEFLQIPPMLAQPFIENAIEHGIKHREIQGHIDIRFRLKDKMLVFEVEDDGIGRQKAREIEVRDDPEHRSIATSLTRERLAILNRKRQMKIGLEIIDLKNALGEAAGTRVTFGIPVIG